MDIFPAWFPEREVAFRRTAADRCANADRVGLRWCSRLLLVYALLNLSPHLSEAGSTVFIVLRCLLAEGVALCIVRRRRLYVRHRQQFVTALFVLLTGLNVAVGGVQARQLSGLFGIAFNSSGWATLLTDLLLRGPLWLFLFASRARLLVRWSLLLLPLLAVAAMQPAQQACKLYLQVPGIEQPLSLVWKALDVLHLSMVPLWRADIGPAPTSVQMCLGISAYFVFFFGTALPLYLAYCLEWRARAAFAAEARHQRRQLAEAVGGRAGGGFPPGAQQPSLTGLWPLDLHFASAVVWCISSLAPPLARAA